MPRGAFWRGAAAMEGLTVFPRRFPRALRRQRGSGPRAFFGQRSHAILWNGSIDSLPFRKKGGVTAQAVTEPANKKSRGNEVKIGERRGEKKGTANRSPPRRRSKKAGVAQPASRIKDKRPGGRAYGILDCGTPPVLWSSQGVVTNPCQPGLTSCDAEAGTSHRPFALRQSRTLP